MTKRKKENNNNEAIERSFLELYAGFFALGEKAKRLRTSAGIVSHPNFSIQVEVDQVSDAISDLDEPSNEGTPSPGN